jgi:diacylglycerol O-acyltransferase
MERLSPQDAVFLHLENDTTQMHIGGVAVFEGPPPPQSEVLAAIRGKLSQVPRYRQRVRVPPLHLGRPVWVDDPYFALDYHVRRTALPAPGGDEQLRLLVGRVMSQALDRTKPLWELWVVEGLAEGRWVLLSKVHHAMVDGVSGTDLLAVLLDRHPDSSPAAPDDWSPHAPPSTADLITSAVAELAFSPAEGVRRARSIVGQSRETLGRLREAARGSLALGAAALRTATTSLNGPIGPHRRWDRARADLHDVKAIRASLGGTVNDVVLAAITSGFRELLLSRGEPADGVVRTMVPVSVRAPDERGTYNNRVSAIFADLPVGLTDPADRLRAITVQLDGLKKSKQAVAGEVLTSLGGFAPPLLLALGARASLRVPQRNVNTVTTNVPGPQFQLYLTGRRMLESYPYVPLAGSFRIVVAIFSYAGTLTFGVTGDGDTAADIGVLCSGIETGVAELVAAARPGLPAKRAARKKTGGRTRARG